MKEEESVKKVKEKDLAIIANIGSASKKYSIYRGKDILCKAHFETEDNEFIVHFYPSKIKITSNILAGERDEIKEIVSADEYDNSLFYFYKKLIKLEIFSEKENIDKVALRVVSPGTFFQESKIIDKDFERELKKMALFDKLHIGIILEELENIKKNFKGTPIFAISDSEIYKNEFFQRDFSIEKSIADKYDLHRFGYHGLSIGSILNKISHHSLKTESKLFKKNKKDNTKIIICHLGSGCSVTAVFKNIPIYNSMGYAPTEGLLSSTRTGDIGAGAVLKLVDDGLDIEEILNILYHHGGLRAISQISKDMRVLIEDYYEGKEKAIKAIDTFTLAVAEYISKSIVRLGGVDIVVFSGTIGFRSEFIRNKILEKIKILNLKFEVKIIESNEEEYMLEVLERIDN